MTIPEEARTALGLEPGHRITWEIQGELYGILKSEAPAGSDKEIREASKDASVARHQRISG